MSDGVVCEFDGVSRSDGRGLACRGECHALWARSDGRERVGGSVAECGEDTCVVEWRARAVCWERRARAVRVGVF